MTVAADRTTARFKNWFALDFTLVVPSIIAGLVTGVIGVIRAISYAALIYAGPLDSHLAAGVGMTVFSTGIVTAVAALTSALPGMIATPLAAPTALLAIMAGTIATRLVDHPDGAIATLVAAIVLTSALTGGLLLTLGQLRWGDKIRLVPYPVVGGFMAGTGWLLVDGFVQVTTEQSLTWQTLPELMTLETAIHWGVGLSFTLILLLVAARYKHYLVMPGTLMALVGVFYLVLWGTGLSLTEARAAGWLLGPFPAGGLWEPLHWQQLTQVQGSVLFGQAGSMVSIALVSLLSLILSNSGIELAVGQDLDLNQEMRSLGIANLLSGAGGGMVGSQALPSTLLVHEIGGHSRLTGIISALPALAVLLLGSEFLSYLPKPILGCLLLYLGISLLTKWLYQAWFKLPLLDYLTIVVIVMAINVWGFLTGILVGFVMAVLLFMYHYSQVNVAKEVLSGAKTRSNREYNAAQKALLKTEGDQILILELQGFLFFGTATYLLNQVKQRTDSNPIPKEGKEDNHRTSLAKGGRGDCLRFIILDFRQVTGIDSSAVLSCNKILKIAHQHQLTLIFTNLSASFQSQLQQGEGIELSEDVCKLYPETRCLVLPDIDRGLEWCESQLLRLAKLPSPQTINLAAHLQTWGLNTTQVSELMGYLRPRSVAAQTPIYATESGAPQLYLLESGRVTVLLELSDGTTKRMQTQEPGAILGEMRFYGKPPLSTAVIAETDCLLQGLSRDQFEELKQSQPAIAAILEERIIQLLCDSLARREQQLRITR
ncbi:MAG: SLC26A/SulP transporter family protein [Spirulina sp. SIO3F2]|nr:SLC26A/SulP transporter family protein [Spirulina sp. SIO3F2]